MSTKQRILAVMGLIVAWFGGLVVATRATDIVIQLSGVVVCFVTFATAMAITVEA